MYSENSKATTEKVLKNMYNWFKREEKKIKSNSLLKPEKAGKKVDDKKKQRTRQQIENRTSSGR